ncbi:TM2 domain-containing protein biscotti [Procambarus clarkii]|uniref:TM2 domain-containing protein biscotti n=1 Tax=Procambarus clarkii TaxID=6728 RepID=UPI001E675F08|nr:TM2 domain-containing protein CG10795-like [Procambarus clarkii]
MLLKCLMRTPVGRHYNSSIIWALLGLFMAAGVCGEYYTNCSSLLAGQFLCTEANIDPRTQQPRGCTKAGRTKVVCTSAPGIVCTETNNGTFEREIPCRYTNGYSYETALLLSVFLGMFGIDRIYLGYYAVGLAKFCTLGFLFLGQLIDIILIATQTVGPADGSHYVISYYGAGIEVIRMDNMTYRMPQEDWGVVGRGVKDL